MIGWRDLPLTERRLTGCAPCLGMALSVAGQTLAYSKEYATSSGSFGRCPATIAAGFSELPGVGAVHLFSKGNAHATGFTANTLHYLAGSGPAGSQPRGADHRWQNASHRGATSCARAILCRASETGAGPRNQAGARNNQAPIHRLPPGDTTVRSGISAR